MSKKILLVIIYLAFISLGLPDGVFGVAWPNIRMDFGLPLEAAGTITIILFSLGAVSSFMSGHILHYVSTGKLVFISCLMTGLALLGYSQVPSFIFMVALAVPLGLGAGAVDSSLNHYVANNYSSRHMSWLHCFWGVGASLGPLIMTKTLGSNLSWRNGYFNISLGQLTLAFILLLSIGMWKNKGQEKQVPDKTAPKSNAEIFSTLAPWMSVIIFLVYTASEYAIGLWANSMLVESRNIPKVSAGLWISLYYACLMGGRLLTGFVVDQLGNRKMISIGLSISLIGVLLLFIQPIPLITMIGLMLIGFGFAPIYPCMMHETPKRFDAFVSQRLIGYQIGSACIGASVLTAGMGLAFSKLTLELLPPILVVLLLLLMLFTHILNKATE